MSAFLDLLDGVLDAAMMLMALAILVALIAVVVLYVIDVTQNNQAIRKNYPVIGRLRYVFEHLGVFFRQYFFAMDREELPFNRAQRAWVARAAKSWTAPSPLAQQNRSIVRAISSSSTAPFLPQKRRSKRTTQDP